MYYDYFALISKVHVTITQNSKRIPATVNKCKYYEQDYRKTSTYYYVRFLLMTLTPVLMLVLYTGEDFLSRVFEKLPGTESAFTVEDHWLHTQIGELLSLY